MANIEAINQVLSASTYLGIIAPGEEFDLQGSLSSSPDGYLLPSGFWFTVEDPGGIDLFLGLSDLNSDLDLYISYVEDIGVLSDGSTRIRENSTRTGTQDEILFLQLPAGDYYVSVASWENGNSDQSSFNLSVDTKAFNDLSIIPDDEYFSYQWYLLSSPISNFKDQRNDLDAPRDIVTLNNADIRAPEAWAIRHDASDVVVAVIDTGVDYTHPDLVNNIWRNTGEIPGNGIDDDGNGYIDDINGWDFYDYDNDPMDSDYHGTHVAGTIGAEGNNEIGISGIAWDTQIMPVRVLSEDGGSYQAIIEGIRYAIDNGADIINLSLGGNEKIAPEEFLNPNGPAGAYYEIFQYALEKDVFIAIAAGNDGGIYGDLQKWKGVGDLDSFTTIPAAFSRVFDNIVSVASTESLLDLAPYSSYGESVTLAAPGGDTSKSVIVDVDVYGTPIKIVTDVFGILSTVPNGKGDARFDGLYLFENGTSMATPVVAGSAALIKSLNPDLSAVDIRSILEESASYNPNLVNKVDQARSLDLESALQLALQWGKKDSITGSGEIVGTEIADLIIGDNTNDIINGAGGNDRMFGGLGVDYFLLSAGFDRIEDYEEHDRLVIAGDNIGLKQVESGILISYDEGETVVLGGSLVAVSSSLILG